MFSAAEQWNHSFFHTCTQAWSKQGQSGAHHRMAEQNLLHLFALRVLGFLHSLNDMSYQERATRDALLNCFLFCHAEKSRLLFMETITSFFSDSNDAALRSGISFPVELLFSFCYPACRVWKGNLSLISSGLPECTVKSHILRADLF